MHGDARITAMVILLACPAASADPDGRARAAALYQEGALSRALTAYEEALRAGGDDRDGLADIYLHLGILRAGSRDPEGAEAAFLALLDLDPSRSPPADSSPLVTVPFARARERRGDAPALGLAVDGPRSVGLGEVVELRAHSLGDRAGLAAGAQAEIVGPSGRSVATARGTPPLRLSFPRETTSRTGELSYRVELLDAWGSVLDTVGLGRDERTVRVLAASSPREPPRHVRRRRHATRRSVRSDDHGSALASPWFWGGAAVIIGAAVLAALAADTGDGRASFPAVEEREP